jgi:hypothetical protein
MPRNILEPTIPGSFSKENKIKIETCSLIFLEPFPSLNFGTEFMYE